MSAQPKEILYWNRSTEKVESELIYGESFMRWFYETASGKLVTNLILSRRGFSQAYGRLQSSGYSARKIDKFIGDFKIAMHEFEPGPFKSFNDFFIRKFKPGARPFVSAPGDMPAPCEARYLAWDKIREEQAFPVKGAMLSAEGLLGDRKKAAPYVGGPLIIARLCPTDYHRFHYPDSGSTLEHYRQTGKLHSVSPLALASKPDIFITNERHVSLLKTESFGRLAYIEVGAICVGKIVQSHPPAQPFKRGDEKGYFLFGGSTVIVLGEPGAWRPEADLLEQTGLGRETLVRLGERVAVKTG